MHAAECPNHHTEVALSVVETRVDWIGFETGERPAGAEKRLAAEKHRSVTGLAATDFQDPG